MYKRQVPDRTEAEHIRKENPLPKAEISLLDRFLSTVVNPVFYKLFVHAGKFRTTERCTAVSYTHLILLVIILLLVVFLTLLITRQWGGLFLFLLALYLMFR